MHFRTSSDFLLSLKTLVQNRNSNATIKQTDANDKMRKDGPANRENSHCDSVRSKSASSSLVLEPAVVILRPNVLKLGVVLEGVNNALAFDGVSALNVVVVREEKLLSSMELPPPSNGLLGAIVPPDPDLDVVPVVRLDLLDAGNIRGLTGVGGPHQDAIADPNDLVGALDGVGVEVPLAGLGLGHKAVSGLRHLK